MSDVQRFAEDALAHVALGPDQDRVEDPRFVVTFSPGMHFWSVAVARVRLHEGHVASAVAEVRDLIRSRDRAASVWALGDSATPAGLASALEGLGMEREGTADVLALTRAPASPRASAFVIREVRSLEDLHHWIDVSAEGFGWSAQTRGDERARAEATLRADGSTTSSVRLIAMDGPRPVAVMRARYTPAGGYLSGAATLPGDRRRGAMSALVGAAWQEAARRGIPSLAAHGGPMSSPTFMELGFRKIGGFVYLIDRL